MKENINKNLILIFMRNPKLGKVKTRLAKSIGDKNALEIYKLLLNHTQKVTVNLTCDKAVYYSIKIRNNDIWDENIYQKYKQKGEDLGIKMHNAFEDSFKKGYEKVIIIGSDLYDLQEHHINKAFKSLDNNDVVIGPAEDGGYYLLGMKQLHNNVFKNKKWGTKTVKENTLEDLKQNSIYILEELNDIDVYDDLEKHDQLLECINI